MNVIQHALFALASVSPIAAVPSPGTERVDPIWFDGQAEVSGYRLEVSRYGERRQGEAIAIFVTEPFSEGLHVKLDAPDPDSGDALTAMKLNLIRDFQTGIYDYNTMSSVFVGLNDLGLMKATFSSAEWCGHVFEEIDVRADTPTVATNSYFQGETGTVTLDPRPDHLIGDQIFIWARGLRGMPLEPGASATFPFLASSFDRRMGHRPADWKLLTATRSEDTVPFEHSGTTSAAIVYELKVRNTPGGTNRTGTIHVEAEPPHRLLGWKWVVRGKLLESAQLAGSRRLPYWKLHGEGQESLRGSVGLSGGH